ncbi:MAG: class IV adenylate cyclase [Sphaerochaetaceae bacterium]
MHWEVECKIALRAPQVQSLKIKIGESYPKAIHKKLNIRDTYWGKGGTVPLFRVRNDSESLLITIKKKSKGADAVEVNQECEFSLAVQQAAKVVLFFKELGYTMLYEKEKIGEAWILGNQRIEIVEVPPLGHFLEIELIVGENEHTAAYKQLAEIRATLGVLHYPLEERFYSEMLFNKR